MALPLQFRVALDYTNIRTHVKADLKAFLANERELIGAGLTSDQLIAVLKTMDTYRLKVISDTKNRITDNKEFWSDKDQCFYTLVRG
ncbi:MAG: hypothetical protein ACKO0Z_02315 [Betaproteobacteria bacterium]